MLIEWMAQRQLQLQQARQRRHMRMQLATQKAPYKNYYIITNIRVLVSRRILEVLRKEMAYSWTPLLDLRLKP
jgi:hypothetical protein